MAIGLLFDCDQQVVAFTFRNSCVKMPKFDRALGLVKNDELIGGIIFQGWNGSNVEMSYYGENTLTPGIVRCIARFALVCFPDLARGTVIVSKRRKELMRSLARIGFRLEGVQRCYYGLEDCNRNTGVRFVMFRDRIEEVACFEPKGAARCS